MEAFVGPLPKGMSVNHKNGEKSDNRTENLEYVTLRENELHAVRNGLKARGERHFGARLTEEIVRDIRKRVLRGEATRKQIREELNMPKATITQAISGTTWRHIADVDGEG